MHRLLFFASLLLTPGFLIAQTGKSRSFKKQLKNADTILLISHKMIEGSTDQVFDRTGNIVILPKLVVNEHLNTAVIIEQKVISDKAVDSLLDILTLHFPDGPNQQGGCFVSRQSIIIIKNSKVSYIDICFHCHSYETSEDLKELFYIDFNQWDLLVSFFRRQGFTYELDDLP